MSQWMRVGIVLLLTLGLGTSSVGGEEEVASSQLAVDLAWLSGCWSSDESEECWMPPKGGVLVGLNRGADGRSFEFLRIAEEEGELVYWASPGGRCPATPFRAMETTSKRVVFGNPAHDFPQQIEYWLDAADVLHARVSATVEGESPGFEITWSRSDWSNEMRLSGGQED